MPRRIVLVRHGRSGHVHSGLLDAAQFRRWRDAYEAAGIAPDETPPAELQATAAAANVLAASDAPRAIASAALLAPARPIVTSPLLRELELPPPNLGPLRLPLIGWALAIGFRSLLHAVAPEEAERARAAAQWLAEIAGEGGTVVAVTHGSVRRLIAQELRKLGWSVDTGRRGIHHWSAWSFRA